jgi:2-polyprenyl-3-methyl-5-hydroxy-6-metoxy-1,4-benzoquinol methylase
MSEESKIASQTEAKPWARHENEAWQNAIQTTKEVEQLYNKILTAVDQALKITPFDETTSKLRELRSHLNESSQIKDVFRKDTGRPYSWRWWLYRFSPLFWFRKLTELAIGPFLVRQQDFNTIAVKYVDEMADYLTSANQRIMGIHQLLGAFFLQITPWIDVKIREVRSEQNYNIANHYGAIIHSHIHEALQDYNDKLQKQLHGLFVLIQPIQILEQQTIQLQRELEDVWHGLQKVDGLIEPFLKNVEEQVNQLTNVSRQIMPIKESITKVQELRQLIESFEERYYPAIRVEPFELERIRTDINQLKNHMPLVIQPGDNNGRPPKAWEFPKSRDLRYEVFEDIFRGSSEWVKKKLEQYLNIFKDAAEPIVDIGCGRGEFLELMRDAGKEAYGIEINQHEIEQLKNKGIRVVSEDAIDHIDSLANESIGGGFCAQVVEHLTPDNVYRLVTSLQSKMKSGAPLVIETINPLSIQAFHSSYLVDPTHIYPVHPQTLLFFLRYAGFKNVHVKKITPFPPESQLQNPDQIGDAEVKQYLNALVQRLNSILYDFAEYYVLGYKP